MTKEIDPVWSLVCFGLLGVIVLIGLMIKMSVSPSTNENNFNQQTICEETAEKIFVSDRLDQCEAVGGKYGIFWSDFTEDYRETCKSPEEFFDF